MDNQKIPEDVRVIIACTYLEGQAYHWWESILSIPDTQVTTWEEFETIFLEKYFPSTLRSMKAREFVNLVQGELTIVEYEAKFEELMRFAPYMIPDDTVKARKFKEGLRQSILEKVEILKLSRYADVKERAYIAERSENKRISDHKDLSSGHTNKRTRFNPFPYQPLGSQEPQKCYHCQQIGHIKKNCPRQQRNQGPQVQYRAPQVQFYTPQTQFRAPPPQNYVPYQTQGNWPRPQVIQQSQRLEGQFSQARPRAHPNKKSGQLT
ncbi:uncharacterized protein [Malus domestica]|uniref:uncharacterized protein n=1 Tax=Malus domestica TaxID=3750 RepID=UPI003976B4CB